MPLREGAQMVFHSGMKISRLLHSSMSFLFTLLLLTSLAVAQSGKYLMYVGTYTGEKSSSKGIYAYRYDAATKDITSLGLAAETTNPSWIAIHPDGRFLYAVNELGNYKGPKHGRRQRLLD